LPGTPDKVAEMQERLRLKQPLTGVVGDATLDDLTTGLVGHRTREGNDVIDGQVDLVSRGRDTQAFARQLRRQRIRAGLTVAALALLTGQHRGSIHRLETGQGSPTVATVIDLATALGCDPVKLLP
jgi:DNA-binding XRE family transcriptional regulator